MKILFAVLFLAFVVFPSTSRHQGCARSLPAEASMTVSVDWLAQHINDPKLVLLHVGAKPEYEAGHIPAAQYITLNDVSLPREESDLALQLPPADRLKTALEKFGISNDSRIVLYWGKDWTCTGRPGRATAPCPG